MLNVFVYRVYVNICSGVFRLIYLMHLALRAGGADNEPILTGKSRDACDWLPAVLDFLNACCYKHAAFGWVWLHGLHYCRSNKALDLLAH